MRTGKNADDVAKAWGITGRVSAGGKDMPCMRLVPRISNSRVLYIGTYCTGNLNTVLQYPTRATVDPQTGLLYIADTGD